MAIVTVRNLKPALLQRLREQAAANGRSTEAEAQAILEAAVGEPSPDLVESMRGFAEEACLTDDAMAIIFPPRVPETQRPISLGEPEE